MVISGGQPLPEQRVRITNRPDNTHRFLADMEQGCDNDRGDECRSRGTHQLHAHRIFEQSEIIRTVPCEDDRCADVE